MTKDEEEPKKQYNADQVLNYTFGVALSVTFALSAFCLGNGDMCRMTTPELHDNIENKSFILTNELAEPRLHEFEVHFTRHPILKNVGDFYNLQILFQFPKQTTLFIRGYKLEHLPSQSNRTVSVYKRKFYVSKEMRSDEEYGLLRYLSDWTLNKTNHTVNGILSWANKEYLWSNQEHFAFNHCRAKNYFCKFCVSFEKGHKCKIKRDFTAKTRVWIKFNPDYFRVERVIMIEEDQHLTSFNGTGYDSRVMFHINNELDRQLQEVDEILSSVNTSYEYDDTGGSGSGGGVSISM